MTLVEIFKEIGHFGDDIGCNDKGGQHSYLETYDKLFALFKFYKGFLEIGLATGDSIRLFNKYFVGTTIYGIDISVVFEKPEPENGNIINIFEADATSSAVADLISIELDIIIDDASHMENDQVTTFNLLKRKMAKGGLYIIEDILSIDTNRKRFESLHDNCEIIDLRKIKGRFDDVLIIYRF